MGSSLKNIGPPVNVKPGEKGSWGENTLMFFERGQKASKETEGPCRPLRIKRSKKTGLEVLGSIGCTVKGGLAR